MDWAWKLGRILGIDFKIHFTFPLIVFWFAFQWGSATGAGMIGYIYGAVLAIFLFTCVLLHELGHSVTAMRYGIKVKDITLTPIGGVAQLTRMPENPKQELVITAAGPIVNFVIAGLLLPVVMVFSGFNTGLESWLFMFGISLKGMVTYLFISNLALGLFNLLPAFPLDGGRILRAGLSLWLGDDRATRIAVGVGQVLAVGLGLYGLMSGAISLLLIAGFIFMAGAAESRMLGMQRTLSRLNASQALQPTYVAIQPETQLYMVMEYALRYGLTHFPVMNEGKLVGVLSRERMLEALHSRGPYVTIGQIMQTDFTFADAGESLLNVQQRMVQTGASAVGVFQNGNLLGLLTPLSMQRAYNRLLGMQAELVR